MDEDLTDQVDLMVVAVVAEVHQVVAEEMLMVRLAVVVVMAEIMALEVVLQVIMVHMVIVVMEQSDTAIPVLFVLFGLVIHAVISRQQILDRHKNYGEY
jgi:ABC-type tungstate transport system substrate-binding protein